MPVFGTSAATFNDDGVTALYQHLRGLLADAGLPVAEGTLPARRRTPLLRHPPGRARRPGALPRRDHRDRPRLPRATTERWPRRRAACSGSQRVARPSSADGDAGGVAALLERRAQDAARTRSPTRSSGWPAVVESYSGDEQVVRGPRQGDPHPADPGVAAAATRSPASRCPASPTTASWCASGAARTCPATSPSPPASSRSSATARTRPGCSPARATRSAPTAASRSSPHGDDATRLSTAFDSVTLYGRDPDPRPDVYGKVGTSGVSVATLDDMKALYDGFDLVAPTTSVSMTINGPAPTVLAFFLNTAIDQQVDAFREREGREPSSRGARDARGVRPRQRPRHRAGRHPQGGPGPEHLPVLHRVLACG